MCLREKPGDRPEIERLINFPIFARNGDNVRLRTNSDIRGDLFSSIREIQSKKFKIHNKGRGKRPSKKGKGGAPMTQITDEEELSGSEEEEKGNESEVFENNKNVLDEFIKKEQEANMNRGPMAGGQLKEEEEDEEEEVRKRNKRKAIEDQIARELESAFGLAPQEKSLSESNIKVSSDDSQREEHSESGRAEESEKKESEQSKDPNSRRSSEHPNNRNNFFKFEKDFEKDPQDSRPSQSQGDFMPSEGDISDSGEFENEKINEPHESSTLKKPEHLPREEDSPRIEEKPSEPKSDSSQEESSFQEKSEIASKKSFHSEKDSKESFRSGEKESIGSKNESKNSFRREKDSKESFKNDEKDGLVCKNESKNSCHSEKGPNESFHSNQKKSFQCEKEGSPSHPEEISSKSKGSSESSINAVESPKSSEKSRPGERKEDKEESPKEKISINDREYGEEPNMTLSSFSLFEEKLKDSQNDMYSI